jgi:hypothetical protein
MGLLLLLLLFLPTTTIDSRVTAEINKLETWILKLDPQLADALM